MSSVVAAAVLEDTTGAETSGADTSTGELVGLSWALDVYPVIVAPSCNCHAMPMAAGGLKMLEAAGAHTNLVDVLCATSSAASNSATAAPGLAAVLAQVEADEMAAEYPRGHVQRREQKVGGAEADIEDADVGVDVDRLALADGNAEGFEAGERIRSTKSSRSLMREPFPEDHAGSPPLELPLERGRQ